MSDTPNTWTFATIENGWGQTITAVRLFHRYDNDHDDTQRWPSVPNGQRGVAVKIGYWTGFLRTGSDYWRAEFEVNGKRWTCADTECVLHGDDAKDIVVCRVYQDGGKGMMKIKCPRSEGVTVPLSSQTVPQPSPAATTPAPKTRSPIRVDGTLVPEAGPAAPKVELDEIDRVVIPALKKAREKTLASRGRGTNGLGYEYCGHVLKNRRTGALTASEPKATKQSPALCEASAPPAGSDVVAYYHSHPRLIKRLVFTDEDCNAGFSEVGKMCMEQTKEGDKEAAVHNQLIYYLINAAGEMYRFDPLPASQASGSQIMGNTRSIGKVD